MDVVFYFMHPSSLLRFLASPLWCHDSRASSLPLAPGVSEPGPPRGQKTAFTKESREPGERVVCLVGDKTRVDRGPAGLGSLV